MNNNNKKFMRTMGIFIGIVLILTFFSKTIYNFNLPTVTVEIPKNGKLVDVIEERATITYLDSYNIYAETSGKIKDIFVEVGSRVKKGQTLISLELNINDIEQFSQDIQKKEQDIELLTVKLKNSLSEIQNIKSDLTAIKNETYVLPKKSEYELDINIAEKALKDKQELFDLGTASSSEVDEAKRNLDRANMQYQQYIQSEKDNKMELLKNKQEEISDLPIQVKNAQLELEQLKKKLARAKKGEIYAETDGIIKAIKAGEGMIIATNDILLEITEFSNELKAELLIDEEKLNLISEKSVVEVMIKGVAKNLKGEISDMESVAEEKQKVTIKIKNVEHNLSGKIATIKIKTESEPYSSVIPNYALRKEASGYYLLVLRDENSIFGKRYTANKVSVNLLNSDNTLSAIEGLTLAEPIITASTSPIENGSSVKFSGDGDKNET